MDKKTQQHKKKVLIIGNGFGGTYTLKSLHKLTCKDKHVEIALVGERNYFLFTPLLHEVATGSINPENIVEPIRKVLGHCISDFYLGRAERVNLDEKIVKVGDLTLPYDYLVLAPGAETNFFGTPGASEHALTLKTIEDAIKIKNKIIEQLSLAVHVDSGVKRKKMLTFTIVGGGPTGIELAAEMQEFIQDNFSRYYSKEFIAETSVILVQRGAEILPQFNEKIRAKSLEFLRKKNVKIILNTGVTEVGTDYVVTKGGEKERRIETDTVIWVAGVKPASVPFEQEVKKTKDGRIIVNEYLEIEGYSGVFALGDVAAARIEDTNKFLPALAQVAEKEATAVAKNIHSKINHKKMQKFTYEHSGTLVSLGQWMAIGEISNFTFWGHIAWWLWRTVYLSKLISTRKKMKVAMDWTVNIFSTRDISKL
jgi:NADH:ubiquinone reductase (H+-translocating)